MATATAQRRTDVKEFTFIWEGVTATAARCAARRERLRDRRHDQPAPAGHPRHQGQEAVVSRGRRVGEKDVTFFTRQLATMLRAGVPLLQAFDIVARGHSNARFSG
jgi:type IV pilus assembly protein PilC